MPITSSHFKEIVVTDTTGISRKREFVRTGVPYPKGVLFNSEELRLLCPAHETQPFQSNILKKWNDGSVKWLLLDFAATVPAHERVIYRLVQRVGSARPVENPLVITRGPESWRISTGVADFEIDVKELRPFRSIVVNRKEILASEGSSFSLEMENGILRPLIENVIEETKGPLRTIIRLDGRYYSNDQNTPPRFVCRIHFFSNSSHIFFEHTLHNPRAAIHPGGLWDLGDKGSLLFRELSLKLPQADFGNSRIVCSPEPGIPSFHFRPSSGGMRIYQESSGGERWNSPVHRTRDGNVRLRFKGYELCYGGEKVSGGHRAEPVIWYGEGELGVSAVMPRFWQEFPKAFSIDNDGLKVGLFPEYSPDFHELQGGEQKTTSFYLDFAASPDGLAWACSPLVAAPSPETCHASGVFSALPPLQGSSKTGDLVDQFITADELLKKREVVDEYGWRNFGDLYADHEAVYHKGNSQFVSHYNNQYDLCGGLYRKFLVTGDPHWGKLASDLARHVFDIDLYHTDQDREEYNHGLFWHTDHYLDAGLSTHRSSSKEHLAFKAPQYCGGGPGGEHCYSTGILLHYFITGDSEYRNAVINMADWAQIALSGPRTILAAVKKSISYIKLLQNADKSSRRLFPRHPFTRGTGNVITASLDAFEASGDRKYLTYVEKLIRDTIHPEDDIAARNLLNAELGWSYTVLLSEIAKYIEKKVMLEEFDDCFAYAKSSFLAYAIWMLEHEYPYLDKANLLEYPNETWPAQDLRKSVIFYYAARFGGLQLRESFLERSTYFFETARNQLLCHPTSSFTRPVALILQNGWVGSKLETDMPEPLASTQVMIGRGRPAPELTLGAVISRIVSDMMRAMKETSIKRECAWLKLRMTK